MHCESTTATVWRSCSLACQVTSFRVVVLVLLSSPLHDHVGNDERRSNIRDLLEDSAGALEDGVLDGALHRILAVLRDGVLSDTLLWQSSHVAPPSHKFLASRHTAHLRCC